MREALKPCPFCGSGTSIVVDSCRDLVSCTRCHTFGPDGGIAAWNRRPPVEVTLPEFWRGERVEFRWNSSNTWLLGQVCGVETHYGFGPLPEFKGHTYAVRADGHIVGRYVEANDIRRALAAALKVRGEKP